MTSTWRTLALTTTLIAGSGLMFLGQQSASAQAAEPCVTVTSASVSLDPTGTGPSACGVDARDDSVPLDPPNPPNPPGPVCEILPQLCDTTTTTVPDETTSSTTTTTTTDPGPTDPPTDTVTSTSSTTSTLPTLPTTSTTSTTSEPSTSTDPSTTTEPSTTTSSSTTSAPGTPGGGTGTGTGGGTGSAPTGTLGTDPVDVEGTVGANDCTGLQCADESYLDALGSRTQQNAAAPIVAASAQPGVLARTGAAIPSLTTLAGVLLFGGALLLGARRRLTPAYARRH